MDLGHDFTQVQAPLDRVTALLWPCLYYKRNMVQRIEQRGDTAGSTGNSSAMVDETRGDALDRYDYSSLFIACRLCDSLSSSSLSEPWPSSYTRLEAVAFLVFE